MVLNIYTSNKIPLSPIFRKSHLIKALLNFKKFNEEELYKNLYKSKNCINLPSEFCIPIFLAIPGPEL